MSTVHTPASLYWTFQAAKKSQFWPHHQSLLSPTFPVGIYSLVRLVLGNIMKSCGEGGGGGGRRTEALPVHFPNSAPGTMT